MARRRKTRHGNNSSSVTVEVVATEFLTPDEERDRSSLEKKVERAFYEAGKALQELKERRLYRSTHKSFEDYCIDRFGYLNRRQPYRLISAALVVDNLLSKCDQFGYTFPPLVSENIGFVSPSAACS
jgi:hypothetical protein